MVTGARLRRRTEHRLLAGVAGGVADRLNASVAFIRIFLGLAMLWGPWVLWAYAAAALVIPPRGADRPDWDNLIGVARLAVVLGVPVVVLGGSVYINDPLGGPPGWWIAYYGLLVAGGVALLTADYQRGRARTREEAHAVVLAALPVCGCFLVLAAAMLLAPDVRWERVVPVAALVGAGTLAVAAWRGHLGPVLAPALLAIAVAGLVAGGDLRLQGGVGNARITPQFIPGERIVERRAVGDLFLDLRRVKRVTRSATVEVSVGVGDLHVVLPRGARVELDARVGNGRIDPWLLTDVSAVQGFDQRLKHEFATSERGPSSVAIRLRADVGIGSIEIDRGGS
jgi:phage shock protein PspC (stress-responsive transcriptional regulator)